MTRLPPESYRPGWHRQRIGGELGPHEQAAAEAAEIAAATPVTLHSDALGRTILNVLHNRIPTESGTREEFPATRTTFDIQGYPREIHDARGRLAVRYEYDLLGTRIATHSMEAGARRVLTDAAGKPFHAWDDRGHTLRSSYDVLQRPVASYLQHGDGPELMLTCNGYGEGHAEALDRNLRGRLVEVRDQAGILVTDRFDFKGNAQSSTRRLVADFREVVNWAEEQELEEQGYTSRTRFDALDRPVQMIPPTSGRGGKVSVIEPAYNEANLLERLTVWMDRDGPPGGLLSGSGEAEAPIGITGIDYDAKGQRLQVDHANGTTTKYSYVR